mmetsp:Transcript_34502/g.91400  ORF Transcript_34502/g.91400 Transcript_34502/m.91400 type:complete len:256 (-) Transcript_34502:876-1643(-)
MWVVILVVQCCSPGRFAIGPRLRSSGQLAFSARFRSHGGVAFYGGLLGARLLDVSQELRPHGSICVRALHGPPRVVPIRLRLRDVRLFRVASKLCTLGLSAGDYGFCKSRVLHVSTEHGAIGLVLCCALRQPLGLVLVSLRHHPRGLVIVNSVIRSPRLVTGRARHPSRGRLAVNAELFPRRFHVLCLRVVSPGFVCVSAGCRRARIVALASQLRPLRLGGVRSRLRLLGSIAVASQLSSPRLVHGSLRHGSSRV